MEGEKAGKAVARIGAAAIGGFLTPIVGPEAGAAAGQALMETTDSVIPFLSERAKGRLKTLSDQARSEMQRRQNEGVSFRSDGLLEDQALGDDLLEGVLRGAIDAERDQKAAAMGNLATAVGYEEEISGADALRYIRLVRAASWRQLSALGYFADDALSAEREAFAARAEEGDAQIKPVLEAELSEMARTLELIGFRDSETSAVSNPSNTWGGGQITASSLGKVAPTGLGLTLVRVTRLQELLDERDIDTLRQDLGMR